MIKKVGPLLLLLIFILSSGFGCKTTSKEVKEATKKVTLTFWQAFDDSDAFTEIIAKYQELHPNITIEYKKFRYEEYENELLNAWAEDRGPDIFSIHNTWIKKYQSKIVPMPDQITMAYMVEKGGLQKELVPELKTIKSLTIRQLKENFVDVVSGDVVLEDGKIYALPLSVDTLALFYNKDLLNSAGIVNPPKYWNREFQQNVKKLTKQDPQKGIIQSGVAMGTANNINRFSDILSVLMMQNGAIMTNGNQVTFHSIPSFMSGSYNPGLEALRFYTDFANPIKEVYSWNGEMENALDAFTSGKLAMFFGYSFNIDSIKAQSPKLNFAIAKLPQIEGNSLEVNFANYWVQTVSKKSLHQNEAWDFIQFMAKEENAKLYLSKTKKPTALKSLINEQRDDENLGVFAEQTLSSKSWYKGKNIFDAERAIREMIDAALIAGDRIQEVLTTGATQVQQTIN